MKNKLLIIALILMSFSSCKKDVAAPIPAPINHFTNTIWNGTSSGGMFIMNFSFINETECKLTITVPLFSPSAYFFDYTFDGNTATLKDKDTGLESWVCKITGSTMEVEGRPEVFKRTN
jgi:hypothetical protein